MARENQGLQIALIIFVMLTIILGVSTYLCYRHYDDAVKAKAVADAAASKKDQEARKNGEDAAALKKMVGTAPTDMIDAVQEMFKKDMEKYGGSYSEEAQVYHRLLEKMQKTIDEKNAALTDAKAEIPKMQVDYDKFKEEQNLQIKQFRNEREKAGTDLANEQAKFQAERDRKNRDGDKLLSDLQAARKEASAMIDKIKGELQNTNTLVGKLKTVVTDQSKKLTVLTTDKIGTPNGEITWVNQRNATVWINLGRVDGLMRQVTFAVYPEDVADMTSKSAKKGSIEVTQILGDHLAEARVIDDNVADPILPRDKIFTPLWNAGEKRHFALAGLLDIDGDGRSDLQAVMNFIAINGGAVDCYITDAGKLEGQITVNTNCLILGTAPTDKEGDARQREAFSKMMGEADQLRLPKIQLTELLQRMGWKNLSQVVRFGRGANPKDFRATPPDGVPKKSTGNVSDVFMKRQPPKKIPSSAY